MALVTAHHKFGQTKIGRGASVQQGDQHIGQVVHTFNIAEAYISCQHEPTLREVGLVPGSKRRCDEATEHHEFQGHSLRKRRRIGRGKKDFKGKVDEKQAGERQGKSALHACDRIEELSQAFEIVNAAAINIPEASQRPSLLRLFQQVYDALLLSPIPRLVLRTPASSLKISHPGTSTPNEKEGALVPICQQAAPIHGLAIICIVLILSLSCRNVSGKDVSRVIARCQQDRLLPLLSTLLGFGIARYLYSGQIGKALTGLTGDCILFEDAFRKETPVPMSTCQDFSILKAFLEVHYRGTTGEVFAKTGRFNLMLGSRRGLVIRGSDWSSRGCIKPRQRVVMSVYLSTDTPECTKCQSELIVSANGDFFCTLCQRYFRDCDSLKYFNQTVASPANYLHVPGPSQQSRKLAAPSLIPRIEELNADEDKEEEDVNIPDTEGLQNIDLLLKPCRERPVTRINLEENQAVLANGAFESPSTAASIQMSDWALSHPETKGQANRRVSPPPPPMISEDSTNLGLSSWTVLTPAVLVTRMQPHQSVEYAVDFMRKLLWGYPYQGIHTTTGAYLIVFDASERGQIEAQKVFQTTALDLLWAFRADIELHLYNNEAVSTLQYHHYYAMAESTAESRAYFHDTVLEHFNDTTTGVGTRTSMDTPDAHRNDAPPSLPPPRYTDTLEDWVDSAWKFDEVHDHNRLVPMEPVSSLLGRAQLETDQDKDEDMNIDNIHAAWAIDRRLTEISSKFENWANARSLMLSKALAYCRGIEETH